MENIFWNERYSANEFVYGTEPNKFLKEELQKLRPGSILLLGEGEGRNAVFAAKQGWKVDAFDFSEKAREKAERLAKQEGVNINYTVKNLREFVPVENNYNAVGLIFIHLEKQLSNNVHQKAAASLKAGGRIILEVFSQNQLGKDSGGPQNPEMLYTLKEIENNFSDLKTELLEEQEIDLSEGEFHKGKASVIRYVGKKEN